MLMLTEPQRDLVRDKGTILGRVLLGGMFLVSGLSMLMSPSGSAMFFESVGVPMAAAAVWVVIVWKVLAGAAIVFGCRVGLAAASLILFTIFATLIAHPNLMDPMTMKNLAIIGGLLYLMAYGPGGSNTAKLATPGAQTEN